MRWKDRNIPRTATPDAAQSFVVDAALLICLAFATVVIHLITGTRYGFHRDELATLEDARHLAWGYIAYPPITPFFGRLSLALFGTSLTGFRIFAAVAEAVAVVLTGLMARDLGGRRYAQLVAAAAALPFCLVGGSLMQYVSFDYLCWVLMAYFVVRLLRTEDPRWWLGIGFAVGLGMMAKYSMLFFASGILISFLVTDARRYLRSKWLAFGIVLSLLIFLPNLLWQVHHHFISLDFLRYIHARDIRIGRTRGFIPDQLKLTLFAFPLWMAGLYFCLFSPQAKRFRAVGWMYLIPLFIFIVAKGRGYYLAAAYPMLYAAGSVWFEQRVTAMHRIWARAAKAILWLALAANVFFATALLLPIAPVNSAWWAVANSVNGDFREEFGWPELVNTVASIRDSLPPEDRASLGILAGNYGEAGAINLYGPDHGLPRATSGINSFWLRGYPDPAPQTFIVVGLSRHFLDEHFSTCTLAGHTSNPYGIKNEETEDHPDIYVCRGFRHSWPEFWKDFSYYG
jgi:4-amino-4-deoxy-L-arabinose transferase-like glycosyltransferase